MTTNQTASWALLWSQKQNALHVEPFEDTLSKNRQAYTENRSCDYQVMAVGPRELVDGVARTLHDTMAKRDRERYRAPRVASAISLEGAAL